MNSKSQFKQDLWVEQMTKGKRDGYFVELGARDGIKTSNGYYLEKKLNWKGILLECSPQNIHKLVNCERNNSVKDYRAIYKSSKQNLSFYISAAGNGLGSIYQDRFTHQTPVMVETVTLSDLLREHNAPKYIDYISMDVEGAEEDAFEGFKWDYEVGLWTIESGNWENRYDDSRRSRIREMMFDYGYKLYEENFGEHQEVEDWFYK